MKGTLDASVENAREAERYDRGFYTGVMGIFNGKEWLTPEQPLLKGTQRAALLEKEQIETAVIGVDDLHYFTKVRLINAMIRFEDRLDIAMEKLNRIFLDT